MEETGIGVALGGGAAWGLAGVGVLEVLRDHGVPISHLSGTSMGAVVAGWFAAGVPLADVAPAARRLRARRLFRPSFRHGSLLSLRRIEKVLRERVGDRRIEELPVPLALAAVDLATGDPVYLRDGDLVEGMLSSMAVPGLFRPRMRDGRALADGALRANVPVTALRLMGARRVLAVDNGFAAPVNVRLDRVIGILTRALDILGRAVTAQELARADLVLSPEVHRYPMTRFSKTDYFIGQGRTLARAKLDEIRALLDGTGPSGGRATENRRVDP